MAEKITLTANEVNALYVQKLQPLLKTDFTIDGSHHTAPYSVMQAAGSILPDDSKLKTAHILCNVMRYGSATKLSQRELDAFYNLGRAFSEAASYAQQHYPEQQPLIDSLEACASHLRIHPEMLSLRKKVETIVNAKGFPLGRELE